jgi:hypothetical protein
MAVFDFFISATAWHELGFLKTHHGDIYRVWFDNLGELSIEKLAPDEEKYEYSEAVAALKTKAD